MSFSNKLSPNDWQTLRYSIMWVFQNVAGADGKVDPKEQNALDNITNHYQKFQSILIQEILHSIQGSTGQLYRQLLSDSRGYKQGLHEVSNIASKLLENDELLLFKKSLVGIGYYIANTSGGDSNSSKVSNEELNVLASLTYHIGLELDEFKRKPSLTDLVSFLPKIN